MADIVFQSDLSVAAPSSTEEKATIQINHKGDLVLASGQNKLAFQLMRALNNEDTSRKMLINSPIARRALNTFINLVLRNYRQYQVETINSQDTNFSGYAIYRLKNSITGAYTKVSPNYVQYRFTDTNLFNGTEYTYAVAKAYNNVFESSFTETLSITPYASVSKQKVYVGTDVVALAGDKQVEFYVPYTKKYKGSEVLDDIISIDIVQDQVDPRRYAVNIVVRDLRGYQLPISSSRRKASV